MDIAIISTGSHGNVNVIDGVIAIDCGINFKALGSHFNAVEHILITHQHSDHCNIQALRGLAKQRPSLIRYGLHVNQSTYEFLSSRSQSQHIASLITQDRLQPIGQFDIVTSKGQYHIETYPLSHDVENQGFIITSPNGKTLIHATDTTTMKYAPKDRTYDYLLIEGNYDDEILLEHLEGDEASLFRAMQNTRHLSNQQCIEFVIQHAHRNSIAYQLHKSYDMGKDINLNDIISSCIS